MKSFRYILFRSFLVTGILIATIIILIFGVNQYSQIRSNIRTEALNFAKNQYSEIVGIYEGVGLGGNKILTQTKINALLKRNLDTTDINIFSFDGKALLGEGEIDPIERQEAYFKSHGETLSQSQYNEVQSPFEIIVPDDKGNYIVKFSFADNRLFALYINLGLLLLGSFVVVLLAGYYISRQASKTISRPLELIAKIMKIYGQTGIPQDTKNIPHQNQEIKQLSDTFTVMERDLEKAHKEHIEKEKIDHEISLAGQIQQRFLPKGGYESTLAKIDGILLPATTVGGDMYDILHIGKSQILFYLADVTGHGIGAGVISSMISSGASILGSEKNKIGETELKYLALALHKVIFEKTESDMFATAVFAVLDEETGKVKLLSCGHEQTIIHRSKTKTNEKIPKGGLALGLVADISASLQIHETTLEKGDSLFLYSDGVPEAWNKKKEQLGLERFEKIIDKNNDSLDQFIEEIKSFTGKSDFEDDVTILRARRN